jgi:hypothetical protein
MTINYRLFFNNNPATREQLDRVEEITVEQEIDMAWEARMQIPIATDDKGKWTGEDEDFLAEFTQVRVEIELGDQVFVPLIDGSIVEAGDRMNSEPSQSMKTVVIQDDSIRLNRDDRIFQFENLLDHEIASQLFEEIEQIATTEIENTPAPSSSLPPVVVQRGTAMQLLRSLARRQGMHAYVLPGEEPGQSIGCFKSFPTQTDGLPPLIVLGAGRNVAEFHPTNNAQRPARVTASTLSIFDKTITQRTSDLGQIDLLGEEQTFASEGNTATQILYPRDGDAVDLDRVVTAEALRSSYSTEATGTVLNDTYSAILTPYRAVSVAGVNQRRSGDYLIRKVTHSLTRSSYSQSFTLQRNARSAGSSAGLANLAGSIF